MNTKLRITIFLYKFVKNWNLNKLFRCWSCLVQYIIFWPEVMIRYDPLKLHYENGFDWFPFVNNVIKTGIRNADHKQNARRETLAVFQENVLYLINLPNPQGSVNYSDHHDCFVECFPIFSSPQTRKLLNATTIRDCMGKNTTMSCGWSRIEVTILLYNITLLYLYGGPYFFSYHQKGLYSKVYTANQMPSNYV